MTAAANAADPIAAPAIAALDVQLLSSLMTLSVFLYAVQVSRPPSPYPPGEGRKARAFGDLFTLQAMDEAPSSAPVFPLA